MPPCYLRGGAGQRIYPWSLHAYVESEPSPAGQMPKSGKPDVLVTDSGPGAFAQVCSTGGPRRTCHRLTVHLPGYGGIAGLEYRRYEWETMPPASRYEWETMPPASPCWTADLEWSEMPIINIGLDDGEAADRRSLVG